MTEAAQEIRLNDEQTTTTDVVDPMQLSGLADLVCPKRSAPAAP